MTFSGLTLTSLSVPGNCTLSLILRLQTRSRHFEFLKEPLYGRAGPVPFLGKVAQAGHELRLLLSGFFLVLAGCENINNVEPSFEQENFLPGSQSMGLFQIFLQKSV